MTLAQLSLVRLDDIIGHSNVSSKRPVYPSRRFDRGRKVEWLQGRDHAAPVWKAELIALRKARIAKPAVYRGPPGQCEHHRKRLSMPRSLSLKPDELLLVNKIKL